MENVEKMLRMRYARPRTLRGDNRVMALLQTNRVERKLRIKMKKATHAANQQRA